jgi:hypothetical protein
LAVGFWLLAFGCWLLGFELCEPLRLGGRLRRSYGADKSEVRNRKSEINKNPEVLLNLFASTSGSR